MRLLRWLVSLAVLCAVLYLAVLLYVFHTAPKHNGNETHFDTLIVLGTPAQDDGTPSPEMRERVEESVREYRKGVAPDIIMTGGAAHNEFVEAQVMKNLAVSEGVPANDIFVEGQAMDTIQNIWFSRIIMSAHNWHSAEVISCPYHLPRTGLILTHYTGPLAFDWRTHASPWPPSYSIFTKLAKDHHEALGIFKLTLHGFPNSVRYLPQ